MVREKTEWTEDQKACLKTLADWARGEHHLHNVKPFGPGLSCSYLSGAMATFDFDVMTRLVLLAHRDAVRIEIQPGSRRLKITAHKRKFGSDEKLRVYERHPSLQDLIDMAEASKKE